MANTKYDHFGRREPGIIYLAKPTKKLICALNGVDVTTVNVNKNGNNTHQLSFDVYRYFDDEPTNGYEIIDEGMWLYLDGIWYIIREFPEMQNDEKAEYKRVSAESLEIMLLQFDLELFNINNGEASSKELMYRKNWIEKQTEELKAKLDAGEITEVEYNEQLQVINGTYFQVKFYDKDNPELSLIDLALAHADAPLWKIGYVDDITPNYTETVDEDGNITKKATFLSDEIYMFSEDSTDLYSFLTRKVSQAYKCIVDFDTVNMLINFYRVESIGKDTNIYLGYQNVQNKITVSSADELTTSYSVSGKDSLAINYVNFGTSFIEDISHFLTPNYMPQELIDKYTAWVDYRETRRGEYVKLSREYNSYQETVKELQFRVPDDSMKNNWINSSVEDLQEAYNTYTALLKRYEEMYPDADGNFDLDALKASPDWAYYESIQNYTLPSIVAALQAKDAPLPNYGQGNFFQNVNPVTLGAKWINMNPASSVETFELNDSPCYGLTRGTRFSATGKQSAGFIQKSIVTTVGQTYTISAYVKNVANCDGINIECGASEFERTVYTFKVTEGSEGWQRIHYTFDATSKMSDVAFTVNGTDFVFEIAGMQMEIGSANTSFGYYAGEETDNIMAFETDWKLFGTVELDIKLKTYDDSIAAMKDLYGDDNYEPNIGVEQDYFYQKRQQYLDTIRLRNECQIALDERNAELTVAKEYHESIDKERKAIADEVSKDKFFTPEELELLKTFLKHKDYNNENILTTSIDNTTDHVDRQWDLYQDALDAIYSEAHRQYTYTDDIENIYSLAEFEDFSAELDIWNYLRIAVRDNEFVKLRVIGITYNPCLWDINMQLEFSNMIEYRSGRNDYNELIDNIQSSQKNNASVTSGSSSDVTSFVITADVVKSLIGNSTFSGYLDSVMAGTITATSVATDKLVASLVKGDEAQFEKLTTTTGFMVYLESQLISADKVVTKLLEADTGIFQDLSTKIFEAEQATITNLITESITSDYITTKIIEGENGDFIDFVNSKLDFKEISTQLITGGDGNTFIDFIDNRVYTGVVQADQIQDKDGNTLFDLINSEITVDTVITKILEADDATLTNLTSTLINTTTINADIGNIQTLLSGNMGTGSLQAIKLTADNVEIAEAVIKKLIAPYISVADLMVHNATAEQITLISADNKPAIGFLGATQQFYDADGNVRVQIGQDATGEFSFVVKDSTGATLITPSGITENAIADGLIINNMISDGTIDKTKLNFPVVATDENGKVSITEILDGEGNSFGISYTEFQDEVTTGFKGLNDTITSLSNMVASVELYGEQVFVESEDGLSPDSITVSALVKNGAEISKWYIDGVENTSYVSSNKSSITIPSSYMVDKKSIVIKVECTDASKYDVMSLYRVVDGSDAYTVIISSSKGTTFKEDTETTCTCTVYKGSTPVADVKSYTWLYANENNTTWTTLGTGRTVDLSLSTSIIKKRLKCQVEI